jgi:outer membrane protein OmpA-like peptidoglycan-associated protein
MGKRNLFMVAAAVSFLFGLIAICQGQDVAGSKDHPFLTRMKDFFIAAYEVKDFDSHGFKDGKGGDLTVEGRKTVIQYDLKEGAKAPTPLQITRNYANAVRKIGGAAFEYTEGTAFLNVRKDGRESWVEVYATGDSYTLTIVEKGELAQEVKANEMLRALQEKGRIALYIHFDTGKAVIKPESRNIIAQIVALLKENPDLRVAVEGHTDDVGNAPANQALSEKRAQAVVEAIAKEGVDGKRLSAAGFGQARPIADNKTEEGKAKNRRVELVKK